MGKLKIECLQKRIKTKKLAKTVYKVLKQKANLKAEVVFKDGQDMADLNNLSRGVDSITDVLSFPSLEGIKGEVLEKKRCNTELDGKYIFIGSIVLCNEKIRAQAKELGHSEEEERNYLIIHGLMHLMGYDHMTDEDKKEMRDKEKAVVEILTRKQRLKEEKKQKKAELKAEKQRLKAEAKKEDNSEPQTEPIEIAKEEPQENDTPKETQE